MMTPCRPSSAIRICGTRPATCAGHFPTATGGSSTRRDIAAGMYAYSGILTALLARTATGVGASLEVSLFDALTEWMHDGVEPVMGAVPALGQHTDSILEE